MEVDIRQYDMKHKTMKKVSQNLLELQVCLFMCKVSVTQTLNGLKFMLNLVTIRNLLWPGMSIAQFVTVCSIGCTSIND